LNGGSPTLEENTKIGENLRLCPNIEETLKLSLKLGGSFRGEFVQKELWHIFTQARNSPLKQGRILKWSPKLEQSLDYIVKKLSPN